jgi:uncharacterized protein (UPF0335 family)
MADTGGVAGDRLKSFIERLENLEEEKQGVMDQIKDVFAEAKAEGFDTRTMRQLMRLRRMRPHDREELEELLDLYKSAVGMA